MKLRRMVVMAFALLAVSVAVIATSATAAPASVATGGTIIVEN